MPTKVSVIIINFNTFDLTSKCIESVIEKTKGCEYEIILVDNNSTECNPDIFKANYPSIELIKSPQNLGFAKGNNLGLTKASGDLVLLLNSDIELINDAISIAVDIFKTDPNIGVLSGQLLFPDGRLQAVTGRFPSIWRQLLELFRVSKFFSSHMKRSFYLGNLWDHNFAVESDWVGGAFFLFQKSDLLHFPKHKLHDTFFMYGEDMQWCHHFKKQLKKKIVYSPLPKSLHFIGGSDKDEYSVFDKYKNKILPNEFIWMCLVKGAFLSRLYFILKALHYYSLRDSTKKREAFIYFSIALSSTSKC